MSTMPLLIIGRISGCTEPVRWLPTTNAEFDIKRAHLGLAQGSKSSEEADSDITCGPGACSVDCSVDTSCASSWMGRDCSFSSSPSSSL